MTVRVLHERRALGPASWTMYKYTYIWIIFHSRIKPFLFWIVKSCQAEQLHYLNGIIIYNMAIIWLKLFWLFVKYCNSCIMLRVSLLERSIRNRFKIVPRQMKAFNSNPEQF